ncbi:hypothetical protein C8F04DRAFT_976725 [Mycena alexandri]|uniref:Uncharacterized protein n=1 Tax=Mycena alexandri TaxID=1745969 RepID=A0AAD6S032_9AGAR|nr:hypothetical protein C8F04DRAFT_976725 [Mycena alexandri]
MPIEQRTTASTRIHLYNLTLKQADVAIQLLVGNFSGGRHQENLVSHDTSLAILRVDAQTAKLESISSASVFASFVPLPFGLPEHEG